jgi:ketosteroid isomerase-like protein
MPNEQSDKVAIQAVLDKWFASYIAKDLEEMMSCHAEELVTIMPFGMPTYGLEPWREILAGAFQKMDVLEIVSDTEEILVLGDWAWIWYMEWAKRRRIETGEEFANFVRGAQMMKRQPDGEWKIARYIGNVVNLDEDEDFDEFVEKFRENSRNHKI